MQSQHFFGGGQSEQCRCQPIEIEQQAIALLKLLGQEKSQQGGKQGYPNVVEIYNPENRLIE
ncbi:hypothetical protein D3C84_123320 [compost metagenome]